MGFVWLLGLGAWSFAADAPAAADYFRVPVFESQPEKARDWPTLAGNMERSNWAYAMPEPRPRGGRGCGYQSRWIWVNGNRLDPEVVAKARKSRLDAWNGDIVPDLITVRFDATPVVKSGVVYAGSVEGDLYAIDLDTGATRWQKKASGPIHMAATATDDAIFVGTIGGLDAFSPAGEKLWTFCGDSGLEQFWACPAVADGLVLIGSLTGHFYGIDAKTGKAAWVFCTHDGTTTPGARHVCQARKDIHGATIYHSPAVYEDAVYFGAENLCAYSLETKTGKLRWKNAAISGCTFGHAHPVVNARERSVLFTTHGIVPFHAGPLEKAPKDHAKSHEILRDEILKKRPEGRTLYVLNLDDGKERIQVATGEFSNGWLPPLPIVRPDGLTFDVYYAREGAFMAPGEYGGWGQCIDCGVIDFQTGYMKRIGPAGSFNNRLVGQRHDGPTVTVIQGGGNCLLTWCDGTGWTVTDATDPKKPWSISSDGSFFPLSFQSRGKAGMINSWPSMPVVGELAITRDLLVARTVSVLIAAYEPLDAK